MADPDDSKFNPENPPVKPEDVTLDKVLEIDVLPPAPSVSWESSMVEPDKLKDISFIEPEENALNKLVADSIGLDPVWKEFKLPVSLTLDDTKA